MRNSKLKILGLATTSMIIISGGNEAFAANGWDIPLNSTTTTTSQVTSSVSLSLNSGTIQTDLDAANATTNPDEAGKVLSQTATITVGNTDGYTVYVSGNTNLTGKNNSSHKIPSITSSKTLGSMSNEWGYYGVLGDSEASYNPSTSFKAMTTSQQSVGAGGATSSSVTKKLTLFYGARVTSSVAEDFYGNTVTLSVVAQPRTVTSTVATFGGITQMQQLTPAICKAANVNDTAFLADVRDGKKYWVTKLLDGNCWMSQNLALDLSTSATLTSATSDVNSSWTPSHNTSANPLDGSKDNTGTWSWNFGDYIIRNPTATTACGGTAGDKIGLSNCSSQFTARGSRQPSTDPNFYKSNAATLSYREYDAHYLAGNYYQWNAATAGTGGTITNTVASGSICPRNWKLPNLNGNSTKGSFYFLLSQYGVNNTAEGTSNSDSNTYNIARSPLFFVRSGCIYPNDYLYGAGSHGIYWSSRASSSTGKAYRLNFSDKDWFRHTDDGTRYLAQPLRCLVPTS